MARHKCKRICLNWPGVVSAPAGAGVRYQDGNAYCAICEIKTKTGAKSCWCCGTILRRGRRNKPAMQERDGVVPA